MKLEYLNDADEYTVKRHSSIDQYKSFLSVKKGGVNVPLRFDKLDFINCDGMKTHQVIISEGNDLGFNFPVGHYTFFTDTYLIGDRKEVVAKKLPEWFGTGWYEKALNEKVFTNFDDSSLGERNRVDLRIGLDYISSDDILEPADE
jgi:hypothetical protein